MYIGTFTERPYQDEKLYKQRLGDMVADAVVPGMPA